MIKIFLKLLAAVAGVFALLILAGFLFIKLGTYQPKPIEIVKINEPENSNSSPLGKSFKILSYNVQYFAGKDYVFFYDLDGFAGPDIRPSTASIEKTLQSIADLILEQNPDIVLLQEIDENAKRTDHKDQTQQLLSLLGNNYPYYAEAYYWKAAYVPHPKIAGSVGMKLLTLSKAPITEAIRHQLPRIKEDPVTSAFNFKRAILETHIETENGTPLVVFNTHLDAFAHSPETMLQQVEKVNSVVSAFEKTGSAWIIGGDFNLLPPVPPEQFVERVSLAYSEKTELGVLYDRYQAIPALKEIQSGAIERWLTHFPNDPNVKSPDRIIDYYFYGSKLKLKGSAEVLQGETWKFSDHLPIVGVFQIQ